MPQEQPLIGEVWYMRDPSGRESRGVIAEVTPTQITLVSMTGNRTRLPPASFRLLWSFLQLTPRTGLSCARRSCPDVAVFRSRRDALDEYVCPRHLPVGIHAEFLTNVPEGVVGNRTYVEVICPSCASPDPTEDLALPRPDRAPWSWWTCHLCSRAWVTVSSPPIDLVDTHARGRWYQTQVLSAIGVVHAIGTVDRIEAGRGALGDVRSVTSLDAARFRPEDVKLVLEIEPSVIHIVMNSRPTRLARERGRMGVQRLGGRPNRPAVEGARVIPLRTPSNPTARPAPVSTPAPELATTEELTALFDSVGSAAPSRVLELAPIGSTWRRASTSDVVVVDSHVRDEVGRDVVRVRRSGDKLISMFALDDFRTAFVPTTAEHEDNERLFDRIGVDEEWRGVDGVAVTVQSKQPKRQTITVVLPSGSTRVLSPSDFRGMQKIVRRTAYERLRAIPTEKKE